MSVITWLKKYGLTILKDATIVLGIGSEAVTQIAPNSAGAAKAADTLTSIANIVTEVETAAASAATAGSALTSAQKLAAADALANQVLQTWFQENLPGTPKVADQQAWETGVSTIVNGVVALLNSAAPTVKTTSGVEGSAVPAAASAAPATPAAK